MAEATRQAATWDDRGAGFGTAGIFAHIPKELHRFIALVEGKIHISNVMKDPSKITYVSQLMKYAQKVGIDPKPEFHAPDVFDINYKNRAIAIFDVNASDSEVETHIKNLLRKAYKMSASDIHIIEQGDFSSVKMRIRGHLGDYEQYPADVGGHIINVLFNKFASATGTSQFNRHMRLDGRIVKPDVKPRNVHSIRFHSEPIQSDSDRNEGVGTFVSLRLLYDTTEASGDMERRLQTLGYLPGQTRAIRRLTRRTGMTLISGPTGSGKSTVLKHIMESMVMESPDKSYFSVEDPPEYPIHGVSQIMVATGRDNGDGGPDRARMYTDAIAGAMRSDPDVIMIGEIRYPEAAVAAIDAALTGHAVWGTIHASDAFGIVTRLEGMLRAARVADPLDALCDSSILSGLCYQRLVGVLCPHCKRVWMEIQDREERMQALPQDLLQRLATLGFEEDLAKVCVKGLGCERCGNSGFHRMTVTGEVVELDPEILDALRVRDKTRARGLWTKREGISHIDHAIRLIRAGHLDPAITESRMGVPLTHAAVHCHADLGNRSGGGNGS
jgi:type II secretory ATPase GspE/PulE/Tfp pilus assembly ATPase PilB-like protein